LGGDLRLGLVYSVLLWFYQPAHLSSTLHQPDQQEIRSTYNPAELDNKFNVNYFSKVLNDPIQATIVEFQTDGNLMIIPGTSFSAPKLSYLAALYLFQGGPVSCTRSQQGILPVTTLGYAHESAGD